jgi:peptide/nickel transport system substrate-binding protein
MEKNQNKVGRKKPDAGGKEKEKVAKEGILAGVGKRQKIALGVIIVLTIATIVGGFTIYANLPKGGDLIVTIRNDPITLDPIEAWDVLSIPVIEQVAEGLFTIDLADPDNRIIPNLATDWKWSDDNLELTCTLRQGVEFHDGNEFNAHAVKWNFDRVYGMIDQINTKDLWLLPDGRWIIKETQVVDDFTVKFVLNDPYVPFEAMLSCWVTSILSPSSTPQNELIGLIKGELIGTGPFVYKSYEPDVNISFIPNPNYWGGTPTVDSLTFSFLTNFQDDVNATISAFSSRNLHLISDTSTALVRFGLLEVDKRITDNPNITSIPATSSPGIFYLRMNNKRIPVEMRKAMAYAFNYTYWLEDFREIYRMRSPIPKGILYSNTEDFDVPVLDLEIARRSLQDANWPGTVGLPLDEDEPWEALVDNNTPIATYNLTTTIFSAPNKEDDVLAFLLPENFKKIGVKIEVVNLTLNEFFGRYYEFGGYHRNMLELLWGAWYPDFNDPSNFINVLMSNDAVSNVCQIDDAQLQTWMDEAVRETDPITRELLYYNIQERFIEQIYPWIMLHNPKIITWQSPNLRGFIPCSLKHVFKNIYLV